MWEKLLAHRGHEIECVSYGDWDDPVDVCIECVDCNEVLVSASDFSETEDAPVSACKVSGHDIPEFIGQIIDIFEDFLEEKGIDIPNTEKEDSDCPAIIYGTDYGELQSSLEDMMQNWDIIDC